MPERTRKTIPTPNALTRRSFIRTAVSVAGGSLLVSPSRAERGEPLHLRPGLAPARVVLTRHGRLVDGPNVHRPLLREMLTKTLTTLRRTSTVQEAWRSILKPDDLIGLKFNRSGQGIIGTTPAFADTLIGSLIDAGWRADRIVCIEAPQGVEQRVGTLPARIGYDRAETDFGSGADQFASVLHQITALINVPFLKTHNIAGMTCALKNLSHGLIKHPARYHGGRCAPYIGDIVGAAPIRSKLRLTIVDALRVVFAGGPKPTSETTSDIGVLIASDDPVAVDATGLTVLNQTRDRFGLSPVASSPAELDYLAAAHVSGLGIAVRHGIDLEEITGS